MKDFNFLQENPDRMVEVHLKPFEGFLSFCFFVDSISPNSHLKAQLIFTLRCVFVNKAMAYLEIAHTLKMFDLVSTLNTKQLWFKCYKLSFLYMCYDFVK